MTELIANITKEETDSIPHELYTDPNNFEIQDFPLEIQEFKIDPEETKETPKIGLKIRKDLFERIENLYKCCFCDTSFVSIFGLAIHEKSHSEKPLKCHFCFLRFNESNERMNHEKSHFSSQLILGETLKIRKDLFEKPKPIIVHLEPVQSENVEIFEETVKDPLEI